MKNIRDMRDAAQATVVGLILAIVLVLDFVHPAMPQVPSGEQGPGGQGPGGMTFATNSIPSSSTKVTFTAPSAYFTIVNLSPTTTVYVSPVNPATTSSFSIAPDAAFSYGGSPLTSIYIIGSAASGSYSIFAH